ncbi:MAG: zinc ribbon domain-containing protein [Caldilineaceae bacterium]|nr:zinc ribbon domain-containing protein [Caldilineaceae bacterium]
MPVYEYTCPACSIRFAHLWKTMAAASAGNSPACPECRHPDTKRVVSQLAVLDSIGGLTPGEVNQVKAAEERAASFTPREHIDQLRAGRAPSEGA